MLYALVTSKNMRILYYAKKRGREILKTFFLVLSIGLVAKLQKAAFLQKKTYQEVRNTLSSKYKEKEVRISKKEFNSPSLFLKSQMSFPKGVSSFVKVEHQMKRVVQPASARQQNESAPLSYSRVFYKRLEARFFYYPK